MNELDKLRKEIDEIDDEIIKKLLRRFEVTKKVAKYKIKNNLEVFQSDREIEIKEKISKKVPVDYEEDFIKLYENIMGISKKVQAGLASEVKGK